LKKCCLRKYIQLDDGFKLQYSYLDKLPRLARSCF
jgi:hypothetical protein